MFLFSENHFKSILLSYGSLSYTFLIISIAAVLYSKLSHLILLSYGSLLYISVNISIAFSLYDKSSKSIIPLLLLL